MSEWCSDIVKKIKSLKSVRTNYFILNNNENEYGWVIITAVYKKVGTKVML